MIKILVLGLTLSSRPVFGLTLPLIVRIAGARKTALALLVALVVTAPVYFWAPADFSPLHLQEKAGPGGGVGLAGAMLAASLVAALACRTKREALFALGLTLLMPGLLITLHGPHLTFGLIVLIAALEEPPEPAAVEPAAARDTTGIPHPHETRSPS